MVFLVTSVMFRRTGLDLSRTTALDSTLPLDRDVVELLKTKRRLHPDLIVKQASGFLVGDPDKHMAGKSERGRCRLTCVARKTAFYALELLSSLPGADYFFPYVSFNLRDGVGWCDVPHVEVILGSIVETGGMIGYSLEARGFGDAFRFIHDADGKAVQRTESNHESRLTPYLAPIIADYREIETKIEELDIVTSEGRLLLASWKGAGRNPQSVSLCEIATSPTILFRTCTKRQASISKARCLNSEPSSSLPKQALRRALFMLSHVQSTTLPLLCQPKLP